MPDNGLTLHELGELIRRLGRENGFRVESEFKCFANEKRAVDWIWKNPLGRIVAAFEIEGLDADAKSTQNDEEKLNARKLKHCPVRRIVLFRVNHNLKPKKRPADPEERVARRMASSGIEVVTDVDLLKPTEQRGLVRAAGGPHP